MHYAFRAQVTCAVDGDAAKARSGPGQIITTSLSIARVAAAESKGNARPVANIKDAA
jgi:enolase